MSIYINDVPKKGWSKKGTNCIIINKNNSIKPLRLTLGMCITKNNYCDFIAIKQFFILKKLFFVLEDVKQISGFFQKSCFMTIL